MSRFRKKPIVIDGYCYNQERDNYRPDWFSDAVSANKIITFASWAEIHTLEGTMRADLGDWIIKEPFAAGDRQFYPCKPDIFAATYEPEQAGVEATEEQGVESRRRTSEPPSSTGGRTEEVREALEEIANAGIHATDHAMNTKHFMAAIALARRALLSLGDDGGSPR